MLYLWFYVYMECPEFVTLRHDLETFCRTHAQTQVRHTITDFFIGAVCAQRSMAAILLFFQGVHYTQLLRGEGPPKWVRQIPAFEDYLTLLLRHNPEVQEIQA